MFCDLPFVRVRVFGAFCRLCGCGCLGLSAVCAGAGVWGFLPFVRVRVFGAFCRLGGCGCLGFSVNCGWAGVWGFLSIVVGLMFGSVPVGRPRSSLDNFVSRWVVV